MAILNNLPNLEYLNGKSTKDDESHLIDLEEREIENISFDKEELEKFNVFSSITFRNCFKKLVRKQFN